MENVRIIVIDDDQSILRVLSQILEDNGYFVETADSGKAAISKCKNTFFNLALIDIRLPDMSGTELIPKLGEINPEMVKIILTGYPSLDNAVRSLNEGADAFLMKPVNMDLLNEKIKKHLAKQAEEKTFSEDKVAKFINTRAKQLGHLPRTR